MWAAKSRKSVHFNEEVEVQIVESPAVEVVEISEVGLLLMVPYVQPSLLSFTLNYVKFFVQLHQLRAYCAINC